ncbi:MAG: hypothetical protein JWL84_2332 [Rhodospirillales bacterium]|nr:hypothetical protein [Rhodospirillales bacterium]
MHEIADRLNAGPAGRRFFEEVPGDVGEAIGLANDAVARQANGSGRGDDAAAPIAEPVTYS